MKLHSPDVSHPVIVTRKGVRRKESGRIVLLHTGPSVGEGSVEKNNAGVTLGALVVILATVHRRAPEMAEGSAGTHETLSSEPYCSR